MSRDHAPEQWDHPQQAVRREDDKRPLGSNGEELDIGRSGASENPSRISSSDPRGAQLRTIEARETYAFRDRTYTLRASELQTMTDIGTFRAVDSNDLLELAYRGDRRHLETDLGHLRDQGLISERTIPHEETGARRLVALTKQGRRLLASTKTVPQEQVLYQGFTKPREAHHDADIYRLYQRGVERIARAGGKPVRVVLDAELKKVVYREIAVAQRDGKSRHGRAEVAERHGLNVVRGKIPVPDLRIEYENPDGHLERLDLELATEHYRSHSLGQKARAGFALYARPQDTSSLRRVLDRQEITAEILNL